MKLKKTQIIAISFMLFAIFFGAGNMIFPPAMGQLAGTNYPFALAGFILTDAGIAILGVTAIVLMGNSMDDLGRLISKKFALCLSIGIYLLIGPLFALPRTGSVSFELAALPFLNSEHTFLFSLIFTATFFLVTYYLSSNPSKIVNVIGQVLTPVLLLSIAAIFFGALLQPINTVDLNLGELQAPSQAYANGAFFQGMMEGYNALDGPAGLAFAILVINAIKAYGVNNKKSIAKYTILCGIGSALLLAIVYFALTYVGAITGTTFSNGGALLHSVSTHLYGEAGGIILSIAVLLACLTTSIGLTTSFSDYFHTTFPKYSYKKIAAFVCIFSFMISNIGLNQLIQISLPILIMIYPVSVVLILLSFLKGFIKERRMVYILAMIFTFSISFINGMENAGFNLGIIQQAAHSLPFYEQGLGWILPALLGALTGLYIPLTRHSKDMSID